MSFEGLDQWVLALLVGLLATRLLRMTSYRLFASPVLERENYRGAAIATAGGLLIVLAVLFVEAGRAAVGAIGIGAEPGLATSTIASAPPPVSFANPVVTCPRSAAPT